MLSNMIENAPKASISPRNKLGRNSKINDSNGNRYNNANLQYLRSNNVELISLKEIFEIIEKKHLC